MRAPAPLWPLPWWSRLLSQRWCGGDPVQVRAESPSRISPIDVGGGTAVDDQRGEEVRRQALFREVNEQIEKLSDGWELFDGSISVLCECGRAGCIESLPVLGELLAAVARLPRARRLAAPLSWLALQPRARLHDARADQCRRPSGHPRLILAPPAV